MTNAQAERTTTWFPRWGDSDSKNELGRRITGVGKELDGGNISLAHSEQLAIEQPAWGQVRWATSSRSAG